MISWIVLSIKWKKKISKTIFQYPVSQNENSGWLECTLKYGDLVENFPSKSKSNGSSFGTRKSNGIELYQPQNATKLYIFVLEESLALVIHTNGSENFVPFCKSRGKGIPNGTVLNWNKSVQPRESST